MKATGDSLVHFVEVNAPAPYLCRWVIDMDDSKSPLRELMAEAGASSYHPLDSLADAQADPHGIAVFEGDDGGQIYLVCPARLIRCSEQVLYQLLLDLDEIEWPGNDPSMRRIYFESKFPGQGVPGGMGGGQVTEDIWIHPRLVQNHYTELILAVLTGKKERIK